MHNNQGKGTKLIILTVPNLALNLSISTVIKLRVTCLELIM